VGRKVYWVAYALLFLALGVFILADKGQFWANVDIVGIRAAAFVFGFAFLTNAAFVIYAYWFPRAPLIRANVSMYFSCAIALTGTPLAYSLSVLSSQSIIPVDIEFSINDAGYSGSISTVAAICSLVYFFNRYTYLCRPENRSWSTKTPIIT
jgi:hypothetical protein